MLLTDANELLKAIRSNNHYQPNKWEEDFLESIEWQIDTGWKPTPTQAKKLQEIYRQCYGG